MPAVTLRLEAILFDMDGVLVDSLACVSRAWAEWARDHGLDGDATMVLGHGRATIDHIRLVAPELATPAEAARVHALEARYAGIVAAQPGALALTRALAARSLRWGVVTSSTRAGALARLAAAGLAEPAVLVTSDDVAHAKPAPDGYRLGLTRLGATPARALVFEDAPAGITAAHRAGIPVCALTTTHEPGQLTDADWRLTNLEAVELLPAAEGAESFELVLHLPPAAAARPVGTPADHGAQANSAPKSR
jgi:sugar-phosphatase